MDIQTLKEKIQYVQNAISTAQSDQQRTVLQSTLEKMQAQLPAEVVEQPTLDFDVVETPIIDIKKKISLSDNSYYLAHPEKVLGEIKVETDRFGKSIEIVKGNMDNLVLANLDYSFLNVESISETTVEIEPKPINEDKVDVVVQKSEKQVANRALKKKQKIVSVEASLTSDMQTFEETYKEYNKDISLEELRVFLWYKQKIGQPLNGNWYELADTSMAMLHNDNPIQWVKDGLLYYYDGELLPAYLYLAENIYEKFIRLVKHENAENAGQDAEYIIKTYGQNTYDNQVAALDTIYKTMYDKRLVIAPEGSANALKLVPFSDFCKNFTITSLADEEPFRVKIISAKKDNGKIDFLKDNVRYCDKSKVETLSLRDAFNFWLAKEKFNIVFKKGVSYSEVIKHYVNQKQMPSAPDGSSDSEKSAWKAEQERRKEKIRSEGERVFNIFLVDQLKLSDKVRIEMTWNRSFNNYIPINFNKVPIAFTKAKDFEIRPEKRDAVSFLFNQGSGCLAYDVGVGKTPSAIFIIRQYIDSGYCKRPMIIVPNQTYRQWLSEIRKIMPDLKINDLYNLGQSYQEELWDENNKVSAVKENSITVLTYEGLEKLGFNEITEGQIMAELEEILNQGDTEEQISEKKQASQQQKLDKIIGQGLKGAMVNIEDIGTDFICFDEAHAMKKIFTTVKGDVDEDSGKRGKTSYKLNSGKPSGIGKKGFMMSQYILRNNHYRNILLLTATPFTNSPLEIFSMLFLVAYKQLQETNLNSITNFFDNYIEMQSELVVTATMNAEYRQVVTGFRNIASLQKLIKRFFDYKDANNIAGLALIRPKKWVLPLVDKVVDGKTIKLDENERVETFIPMSMQQEELMREIVAYANGDVNIAQLGSGVGEFMQDENEDAVKDAQALVVSQNDMDEEEKKGVRIIKSIMFGQNLALSPYLYVHSGMKDPTYLEYIHASPKLNYVMECIKTVKKYHEDHKEAISGQIIYMNRGIEYFPLIKQYLVEVVGFKNHEVGMMSSKMAGGREAKDKLKNLFLGVRYNEQIKSFEKISDDERVKILIGSGTIKEGMNLQEKSTILYNCFLDWNPTDIIQLHGRIFRQGNEFKNVRIVNPLMMNSVDIFLFQKLSEKTARINAIWSTDGETSVLKLDELNPNELKFALIKDPEIIATYTIQDLNSELEDKLASEKSLIKKFENVLNAQKKVKAYIGGVDKFLSDYRPSKYSQEMNADSKIRMYLSVLKNQTDENGAKMFFSFESSSKRDYIEKGKPVSEKEGAYKVSGHDYLVLSNRMLMKEKKDFFESRGLDINDSEKLIWEQEEKIKSITDKMEELKSKEYKSTLVEEIVRKKEEDKIVEKNIPQLVTQFEKLNYLLSIKFDKKEIAELQKEQYNCVLRNENDEIRIDNESIEHLEECIKKVPSTKDLNTVNEDYTEERKKLHQKIYEKYASKKVCNDNPEPIAILTGGSPASGKSTFLKTYAPYLVSDKLYKIDADEVRANLPEYKGWNSAATHEETKDIMKLLLSDENIGKPCKFDLIYDGTMNSTKNYLPLIGNLKRLGYKVFIVYMNNITFDVALARSLERFKKGSVENGIKLHRYVPREVIADFFSKGKEALNDLKTKVDGYMVVDGSNREYEIIDMGGMQIPKDRSYAGIFNNGAEGMKKQQSSEIESASAKEEKIIKRIKVFEMALGIAKKEDKPKIQNRIKVFQMALVITKEKFESGGMINQRYDVEAMTEEGYKVLNESPLTLTEAQQLKREHKGRILYHQLKMFCSGGTFEKGGVIKLKPTKVCSLIPVQSLLFERKLFSKAKAKAWLTKNGYKTRLEVTTNSYRAKQISPKKIDAGSYRTATIEKGIKVITANLK